MQAKMASRSRLLNRLYRGLLGFLIPLFGLLARHLPLGVLYAVGRIVARMFLAVRRKYTRALEANLAQILGEPLGAPRVRALALRTAHNHVRYWIDFFYWSERGSRAARAAIRGLDHLDALERCRHEGHGAILMTAHLGNWEMGGLLLGDLAANVAVIYVPDRFEVVEEHRSRYRRRTGLAEIPLSNDSLAALRALRVLRSGGFVAVQGDRDFDNSGLPFPFFGRTAYFPRGPAVLALIARAPILPVFILRGEDREGAGSGGFHVVFEDPIEPVGDPRDEGAVRALMARAVAAMERTVRAHPDQWYCFYPFWDDPTRAARGDQPGRVAPTAAA